MAVGAGSAADSLSQMSTFVVTGGAGFIGSNLGEKLLTQGHWVRAIDNFSAGRRESLAPFLKDIEPIECDIRLLDTLRSAMSSSASAPASTSSSTSTYV